MPSRTLLSHDAAAESARGGAFWEGYLRSLKPLDVEEPIDVWVHRPLAYVLAKVTFPTPISPNQITFGSIALGLFAGVCAFWQFPHHLELAGLALFLSAVFDCADGQLARMRGTSSVFGRMLDGVADLVVSAAAVIGGTYVVYSHYQERWWHGVLAVLLCAATSVTSSFHTGLYDHYKNLYLRLTHPSYVEGEDYETARARFLERREGMSFGVRLCWSIYLFYVSSQEGAVRALAPATTTALSKLPPYTPESAARYRQLLGPSMRDFRNWFGFGSLVFGISVSLALDVVEYYMLFRLLVLNAVFVGYLLPRQRRASRIAFGSGPA